MQFVMHVIHLLPALSVFMIGGLLWRLCDHYRPHARQSSRNVRYIPRKGKRDVETAVVVVPRIP